MKICVTAQYEHELSGYEDPSILHAYIAYLPSKLAYREGESTDTLPVTTVTLPVTTFISQYFLPLTVVKFSLVTIVFQSPQVTTICTDIYVENFFLLFTVVKFKRRQRYLEFFVQVAQKALTEGMATQVMDWCEDTSSWLTKYVYSL